MPDLEQIWESVRNSVIELAKSTFADLKNEAVKDVTDFLDKTKADVVTWTQQFSKQELTEAEFKSLISGQKDLAEMQLLHEAGVALIKIDKFKRTLFNTIISTIINLL